MCLAKIVGMTRTRLLLALGFVFDLLGCESSPSGLAGPAAGTGTGSAAGSVAPVETKPAPPAATPAPAGFGDVAFKTYRSGGTSVRFITKSKAETWWANMAGETVHGSYEQNGDEIVVHWEPKYTNHGSSQERFHQMGRCSMARYERTDRRSGKVIENTMIYQQAQPRCDTIRLSK